MEKREYQIKCADALYNDIIQLDECHPVAAIPTGAGKTHIMCLFIDKLFTNHPKAKVLVLSHVAEIISQDYRALCNHFDWSIVGIYSAGIGVKEQNKITVAGIQSVYRKPDEFDDYDVVIIDEAHTIPTKGAGMYRSFLESLESTFIGLTATHFRTGHGYIHKGDGALFNHLSYDLTSFDNYNKLVKDGYLCRIITKDTANKMDTKGIGTVAGDFNIDQLAKRFDTDEKTISACTEVVKYGAKNYKKWLGFAINISHAERISNILNHFGFPTVAVHSKMTEDRDEIIEKFKKSKYRCLVNVDILTTGFDVPSIDLIFVMRPSKSPIIHVQTAGRGGRVAPGKDHCLFLDFGGNTERLGPINDMQIKLKKKTKTKKVSITKTCPECGVIHHISVRVCDICDYVFQFKNKLEETASTSNIVKDEYIDPKWVDVDSVFYNIHSKRGSPSSLCVQYNCGMISFRDWVCIDHTGWAKVKAQKWIKSRLPNGLGMPNNLRELYKITNSLKTPKSILVDTNKRFAQVINSKF